MTSERQERATETCLSAVLTIAFAYLALTGSPRAVWALLPMATLTVTNGIRTIYAQRRHVAVAARIGRPGSSGHSSFPTGKP